MSILAKLQQKKKELAAKSGRAKTEKIPNGNSRWRILPHWAGKDDVPSHDFGAHFLKNAADEIIAVYICTLRTFGKACEVCDQLNQATLEAGNNEPLKEQLKEARSAQRYLLNAVRFNSTSKKYDDAVSLLEVPAPVINGILAVATSFAESDEIDIFSLTEGFDITVTREGTGLQTKYNVASAPKTTAISADYMSKVHNLDEYVAQEHEEGKARTLAALASIRGVSPNTPMIAAPSTSGALPASVSRKAAPIEGTAKVVASAPADEEVEDALSDLDLSDVDLDGLDDVGTAKA